MLGSNDSPGVIFHTMMQLYRCITTLRDEKTFQVAVSYCEVSVLCIMSFNVSIMSYAMCPLSKVSYNVCT